MLREGVGWRIRDGEATWACRVKKRPTGVIDVFWAILCYRIERKWVAGSLVSREGWEFGVRVVLVDPGPSDRALRLSRRWFELS